MSVDFAILCRTKPKPRAARNPDLVWRGREGQFRGIGLRLEDWDIDGNEEHASYPLPDEEWADQIVAVIRCEGRFSRDGDDYDAFSDWARGVVQKTRGAFYSFMSGEIEYVFEDTSAEGKANATTRELMLAKDVAGLIAHARALEQGAGRAYLINAIKRGWDTLAVTNDLLVMLAEIHGYNQDPIRSAILEARERDKRLREAAEDIVRQDSYEAARRMSNPTTAAQLRELVEKFLAGDAAATVVMRRTMETPVGIDDPVQLFMGPIVAELYRSNRSMTVEQAGILGHYMKYVGIAERRDHAKRAAMRAAGGLGAAIDRAWCETGLVTEPID